jgi:hypothetical protein
LKETLDIDLNNYTDNDRKAIEKDLPLIEAALVSDHIIITRDESFQEKLRKTPEGKKLVDSIKWIKPVKDGTAILVNL